MLDSTRRRDLGGEGVSRQTNNCRTLSLKKTTLATSRKKLTTAKKTNYCFRFFRSRLALGVVGLEKVVVERLGPLFVSRLGLLGFCVV